MGWRGCGRWRREAQGAALILLLIANSITVASYKWYVLPAPTKKMALSTLSSERIYIAEV
jgi:hypothetical protein